MTIEGKQIVLRSIALCCTFNLSSHFKNRSLTFKREVVDILQVW